MPNVLLLVVDSLRADAVFGHQIPTPNLDSRARRGAAFHQCICASTTTTASFSSMLTGCYPPRHGMRGLEGQRPAGKTMAEMFSDAGYQTHAEVTGHLLPETGILRGFKDARHREADDAPFFGWRGGAVDRIRALAEPWFTLLLLQRPYRLPPRTNGVGYEAAVAATDQWLTPILEAAGLNTIVVITGDHGEDLAEGALRRQMVRLSRRVRTPVLEKRFSHLGKRLLALDEHLIRVPLIMTGPHVGQASLGEQVRHVDLLPTLADLCGLEQPPAIDGRSLRPLMQGHPLREEPAYFEAIAANDGGRRLVGARTPDFKLVVKPSGRPVLYKLPDEKRNQYSRHPEVARLLESFIEEISSSETIGESGTTSEKRGRRRAASTRLGYR